MSLKNKRVLVSGAGGFVGTHLVRDLQKAGAHVETFKGDILSAERNTHGFDVVFHLAAITDLKQCLADPVKAYEVNAVGTLRFLESLGGVGKFIYVSTLGVYGEPKYVPIDEDHPTRPIEPYAASKLAGEAAVEGLCTAHGTPFAIARLFNVYGPGQRPDFVIPRLIEEISRNEEITIRNPKSTRDFIYIDDVITGLLAVAERGKNDIYNLGTGKETSVKVVAETIRRFTKRKVSLILQAESRDGRVKRSRANMGKTRKELGWQAKVHLEEGIRKMLHDTKTDI